MTKVHDSAASLQAGDLDVAGISAGLALGRELECLSRESLRHVDLAAFDDDGRPLQIWPCRFCEPWHIEVLVTGTVVVREWHADTCPHYWAIVADIADD